VTQNGTHLFILLIIDILFPEATQNGTHLFIFIFILFPGVTQNGTHLFIFIFIFSLLIILIVLSHAHCIPKILIILFGRIVISVSKSNNKDGEIIKKSITNEPKVTKISNKESVD
jgi:hypothetical protein